MVHIYGSESHILEGEIVATYHFGGLWSHKYGSKECGSKKSECFKTSNRNIQKLLKIRDNLLPTIQARKSPKTHAAAKKCCGWEKPAIYVMDAEEFKVQLEILLRGGFSVG